MLLVGIPAILLDQVTLKEVDFIHREVEKIRELVNLVIVV